MKKVTKNAITLLMATLLIATCLVAVSATQASDSAEISFDEVATLDPGDINKDKVTNILDLVRLKKYLANKELGDANPIVINTLDKCDIDGNGAVDAPDLVQLRKLLLGINIFEQLGAE